MDYKSKLQAQNDKSDSVWRPTFEGELDELRAEFSPDEVARMASYARVAVPPRVENPARAPLPATLREFLMWAAGRDFMNERREWAPVFTPRGIREYMVEYGLLLAHPTKIPIGMDGGNCVYMVDLATESLSTYLCDPEDPRECGLLASSLGDALLDGRSQIEVAHL